MKFHNFSWKDLIYIYIYIYIYIVRFILQYLIGLVTVNGVFLTDVSTCLLVNRVDFFLSVLYPAANLNALGLLQS